MKRPSPYLKLRVLGAVECAPGSTARERIKAVSGQTFKDEDGHAHRFTWRTIETWAVRYNKHGYTSTQTRSRSDKGHPRKVSPEQLLEAIQQVLPRFRDKTPRKAHLYRACLEAGLLRRDEVAPNTFSRLVTQLELLKPDSEVTSRRRLAFSKAHANDMWQADTLVGPYVKDSRGKPVQMRLIAFIDDASRLLCHGEFFAAENTSAMIAALRKALYKRGVPRQLYVDNGSIYCSKEISLITARIGCLLCHTPVRDGASKGKIERFFRTVREDFLSRQLDLSSLDALNRQFISWAEQEYNTRMHSSIEMRPLDRFGLDLKRVAFLPPCEMNDELFHVEEERKVKADNTFSFRNRRYEAPRHLAGRTVSIRFDRAQTSGPVVVYFKNERMGEAHPLDPVANDRKPSPVKGEQS